jgi:hypothetical protein
VTACAYVVTGQGGGRRTGFVAVVRVATNGGVAPYSDQPVARFYGHSHLDAYEAAARYCVREYGEIGTDPLARKPSGGATMSGQGQTSPVTDQEVETA